MKWMQEMMQSGKLKTGQPLENTGALIQSADQIITDGPFLEPKEIIGGYIIINANDLDEAISEAKHCPLLEHCQIMVRPVLDMG